MTTKGKEKDSDCCKILRQQHLGWAWATPCCPWAVSTMTQEAESQTMLCSQTGFSSSSSSTQMYLAEDRAGDSKLLLLSG